MSVTLYAHPTASCPHNDPATGQSAEVANLAAARDWLAAHGGYASLQAVHSAGRITGWTVMRVVPGYGHRPAGYVRADDGGAR